MNRNLEIFLQIERIKKTHHPVIEIKFNGVGVNNLTNEFYGKALFTKFDLIESIQVDRSVLEIKNIHENHIIISDFRINNFSCLSHFTNWTNEQKQIIIKPTDMVDLRWSSPYSYYFLEHFV